jgi:hypothetical protein
MGGPDPLRFLRTTRFPRLSRPSCLLHSGQEQTNVCGMRDSWTGIEVRAEVEQRLSTLSIAPKSLRR